VPSGSLPALSGRSRSDPWAGIVERAGNKSHFVWHSRCTCTAADVVKHLDEPLKAGDEAADLIRHVDDPLKASDEAADVLVGTSRSQMRSEAERIIASDPNHPLKFLLENGKFKPQKGLSHADLVGRPDLVQMGHIRSNKLGGTERLMLQGAWENQFNNLTIEAPRAGGPKGTVFRTPRIE
jgi:hypothetical protein